MVFFVQSHVIILHAQSFVNVHRHTSLPLWAFQKIRRRTLSTHTHTHTKVRTTEQCQTFKLYCNEKEDEYEIIRIPTHTFNSRTAQKSYCLWQKSHRQPKHNWIIIETAHKNIKEQRETQLLFEVRVQKERDARFISEGSRGGWMDIIIAEIGLSFFP